jgi:hypothetical protein
MFNTAMNCDSLLYIQQYAVKLWIIMRVFYTVLKIHFESKVKVTAESDHCPEAAVGHN